MIRTALESLLLAHITLKLINLISILVILVLIIVCYVGVLHILLLEVSVSICSLVGKLHVLVWKSWRGWYVVNFTGLFTQVTNSSDIAAAVPKLRHWHIELSRLRVFEFHVMLVIHFRVVWRIECRVLAHFVFRVAYVVLKWRISWKIHCWHLIEVWMFKFGCLWLVRSLLSWIGLVVSTSWHKDVATMREIVQADVDFWCIRDHLHYSVGRKSYS